MFVYDLDNGEALKYAGRGCSLYFFDEYEYDDFLDDFYPTEGSRMLTRQEVKRMGNGKELLKAIED